MYLKIFFIIITMMCIFFLITYAKKTSSKSTQPITISGITYSIDYQNSGDAGDGNFINNGIIIYLIGKNTEGVLVLKTPIYEKEGLAGKDRKILKFSYDSKKNTFIFIDNYGREYSVYRY